MYIYNKILSHKDNPFNDSFFELTNKNMKKFIFIKVRRGAIFNDNPYIEDSKRLDFFCFTDVAILCFAKKDFAFIEDMSFIDTTINLNKCLMDIYAHSAYYTQNLLFKRIK